MDTIKKIGEKVLKFAKWVAIGFGALFLSLLFLDIFGIIDLDEEEPITITTNLEITDENNPLVESEIKSTKEETNDQAKKI